MAAAATRFLPQFLSVESLPLLPEFLSYWFPAQLPVFLLGLALSRRLEQPGALQSLGRGFRPVLLLVGALAVIPVLTYRSVPFVPTHVLFAGAMRGHHDGDGPCRHRWKSTARFDQRRHHAASKSRVSLPAEASAAAAEAHLALGARTFENFKRQRIEPPLAKTLNRKLALLQQVKKRAEETVAMRQAEPAVCALAQLGEAQMLLAQSIEESPAPPRLNLEERKLYRDALHEKAAPVLDEARATATRASPAQLESTRGRDR